MKKRLNIGSCRLVTLVFLLSSANICHTQSLDANGVEPQIGVRISTERRHFHPREDIRIRVEIWNKGKENLFISKDIESFFSNALARIELRLYDGENAYRPIMAGAADSFSAVRSVYPPLVSELSRYWVALPPEHFYGTEVVMSAALFEKLKVSGKYRIQGKYISRGFLAEDINNPLVHYAQELKQLPYEAWVGEVETNSVWIEVGKRR